MKTSLMLALLASAIPLLVSCVSVPTRGKDATLSTKGDGVTDDTAAFGEALKRGRDLYVPPGSYLIGDLQLPAATRIHGAGASSLFIIAKGKCGIRAANGCSIADLAFTGQEKNQGKTEDTGSPLAAIRLESCRNVLVDHVSVSDYRFGAVLTDHTTDSLIKDSFFEKVNFGVMIVFSQRITVTGNRVLHPMSSGLQFWGNWQWARKDCADLIFANNHVWIDGPAGSCIWGTGAKRVVMNGNIADGAADVALDLEWCDDSVITGNTVRNFRNAGISLFYSCERIAITGNTVLNDWVPAKEEQAEEQKTGWWVRSGIWLTGVNRKAFKDDNGCRDVAITGNTIVCAPGIHRRTVWIEGCSENILVTGNTVKGGALWHGGGEDRDGKSSPLLPFKDGSLIVNDKEVKQYPLTAPRP